LSKHTAPNIHHCATVEEAAAVVVQQERYISMVSGHQRMLPGRSWTARTPPLLTGPR